MVAWNLRSLGDGPMNSAKPVIALNLPETGPGPELRDYYRVCMEKPATC